MIASVERRYNIHEIKELIDQNTMDLPETAKIELGKMLRREPAKISNVLSKLELTERNHDIRKQKILDAIAVGKQVGEKARAEAGAERRRIRDIPNHAERLEAIRNYRPPQSHEMNHHYTDIDPEVRDIAHGAFQNAMEDLGHSHEMEQEHHHNAAEHSNTRWSDDASVPFGSLTGRMN